MWLVEIALALSALIALCNSSSCSIDSITTSQGSSSSSFSPSGHTYTINTAASTIDFTSITTPVDASVSYLVNGNIQSSGIVILDTSSSTNVIVSASNAGIACNGPYNYTINQIALLALTDLLTSSAGEMLNVFEPDVFSYAIMVQQDSALTLTLGLPSVPGAQCTAWYNGALVPCSASISLKGIADNDVLVVGLSFSTDSPAIYTNYTITFTTSCTLVLSLGEPTYPNTCSSGVCLIQSKTFTLALNASATSGSCQPSSIQYLIDNEWVNCASTNCNLVNGANYYRVQSVDPKQSPITYLNVSNSECIVWDCADSVTYAHLQYTR